MERCGRGGRRRRWVAGRGGSDSRGVRAAPGYTSSGHTYHGYAYSGYTYYGYTYYGYTYSGYTYSGYTYSGYTYCRHASSSLRQRSCCLGAASSRAGAHAGVAGYTNYSYRVLTMVATLLTMARWCASGSRGCTHYSRAPTTPTTTPPGMTGSRGCTARRGRRPCSAARCTSSRRSCDPGLRGRPGPRGERSGGGGCSLWRSCRLSSKGMSCW